VWDIEQGHALWHAFDIIAEAMQSDPGLRDAKASNVKMLVYSEHIVRWFKDKSGDGQWPAVVDDRPGITIDISQSTGAVDGTSHLDVEHTRIQGATVTMHLKLKFLSNSWRSPQSWELKEVLGDKRSPSELRDTIEQGRWDVNQITRQIRGVTGRVIKNNYTARTPTSLYTLLAAFPINDIALNNPSDGLFTEGMQYMGGATFEQGATGNADKHGLAAGLTCYRLKPAMGFPLEFWVNRHGLVVYLLEGATRAWALQSMEARA